MGHVYATQGGDIFYNMGTKKKLSFYYYYFRMELLFEHSMSIHNLLPIVLGCLVEQNSLQEA